MMDTKVKIYLRIDNQAKGIEGIELVERLIETALSDAFERLVNNTPFNLDGRNLTDQAKAITRAVQLDVPVDFEIIKISVQKMYSVVYDETEYAIAIDSKVNYESAKRYIDNQTNDDPEIKSGSGFSELLEKVIRRDPIDPTLIEEKTESYAIGASVPGSISANGSYTIAPSISQSFSVGSSYPSACAAGSAWLDTANPMKPTLKIFDGAYWNEFLICAPVDYCAPLSPKPGQIWVDTSCYPNRAKIYIDGNWKELSYRDDIP